MSEDSLDVADCASEPIRIPGAIQPHGVLLALDPADDLRIAIASANTGTLLGRDPDELRGTSLRGLVAGESIDAIRSVIGEERLHDGATMLSLDPVGDDARRFGYDGVVHRNAGLVVLELMPASGGPRPLTFTDTYRRARARIGELHETTGYDRLLEAAARQVQALTGFDRVMIYRFDEEFNGEVVAETRRDDLDPFLGLSYPASDIPAQARALYERNLVRLVADVDATPVALVPDRHPRTGEPLDLTHCWLRAVSPIHLQYLRNMGVGSSMSVSLLRDGRLWGLIACHHYSGAHDPSFEVCVTAELVGHVLSARLVDAAEQERGRRVARTRAAMAELAVAAHRFQPLAASLTDPSATNVADVIACDRAVVRLEGRTAWIGEPAEAAVVNAIDARFAGQDCFHTESLGTELGPEAAPDGGICGVLGVRTSEDAFVLWLRGERAETVRWGGDPTEKTVQRTADGALRLGPRRSFAEFQEAVRGRSAPWTADDRTEADRLRNHLVDLLYGRARVDAQAATMLQRSLLPDALPVLPGHRLAAHYRPADGHAVGGDWYDAIRLGDDRVMLVVGDISGHGMAAAGHMGQLRAVIRALATADTSPEAIITRVRELADEALPVGFATCLVVGVDLATGALEICSAGHPPPILVTDAAAEPLDVAPLPPLTAPTRRPDTATAARLPDGARLLLYSDGIVERRGERVSDGIERLAGAAVGLEAAAGDLDRLVDACATSTQDDDVTLLVLERRRT